MDNIDKNQMNYSSESLNLQDQSNFYITLQKMLTQYSKIDNEPH